MRGTKYQEIETNAFSYERHQTYYVDINNEDQGLIRNEVEDERKEEEEEKRRDSDKIYLKTKHRVRQQKKKNKKVSLAYSPNFWQFSFHLFIKIRNR